MASRGPSSAGIVSSSKMEEPLDHDLDRILFHKLTPDSLLETLTIIH
jgi:hypothetical protein